MLTFEVATLSMSVVSGRDRDCWGCRAVSGCGLLGIGAYLTRLGGQNPARAGAATLYALAAGFAGLGVARLANFPPFKNLNSTSSKVT